MIGSLAVAHQRNGTSKMRTKHLMLWAVMAGAALQPQARAQVTVDLGSASGFAVLAGSGISLTGTTTITGGDVGTHPTTTTDGGGSFNFVTGADRGGDATTQAAKTALAAAYADAAGRSPTTSYGAAFDLAGLSLTSGVYNGSSSLAITGNLTLNAQGNPNAVWIFQAGSTLSTTANILLINDAQAANVFWQVGSSATLGASTSFKGNILALESITLNSGTTVDGRVLARNAHVTLNGNTITVPTAIPEPAATSLLFAGLVGLVIGVRRIWRHHSERRLELAE